MRDYIAARLQNQKRELEVRAPFREKFYSPDCAFDSRSGILEEIESETLPAKAHFVSGSLLVTLPSIVLHHKRRDRVDRFSFWLSIVSSVLAGGEALSFWLFRNQLFNGA
jgi:hypothetical protein